MLDLETIGEIQKTLAELKKTEALLHDALTLADLPPGQPMTARQAHLRQTLRSTDAHYQAMEESVKKLIDLARRMIEQRQSTRETFNQGWDARLKDLIDRLTTEEYAQLRSALEKIQKQK